MNYDVVEVFPPADEFAAAPVPPRTIVAYLFALFGVSIAMITPGGAPLAIKIAQVAPHDKQTILGIVSGIGSMVALVTMPIAGALSDRTMSRLGMRRPWTLGGIVVGTIALALLGTASGIIGIALSSFAASCAAQFVIVTLIAFIPDQVSKSQRGKISAIAGISLQIAPIVGLIIVNVVLAIGLPIVWMFLIPALIGLVFITGFSLLTKDKILSLEHRQRFSISIIWRSFYFSPRESPDFAWAWTGRFLLMVGFAFFITYQLYFIMDRLHLTTKVALRYQAALATLNGVLLMISATVSGFISDKTKHRKIFVYVSSGLLTIGMVIFALTANVPMLFVGTAFEGVAIGTYFAVDLALVTDILPDNDVEAGRYMGLFNIANTLSLTLAPTIAPLILSIGGGNNYTLLFLTAGVVAVAGALTIIPIKGAK